MVDIDATTASEHGPSIRHVGFSDLVTALSKGLNDFWLMPTHLFFFALIYPIVGIIAARAAAGYDVLPLIYPLAAGYALVGPAAALGFYEISRRRELGEEVHIRQALTAFRRPSMAAIGTMTLILLSLFAGWMVTANIIYIYTLGPDMPTSVTGFIGDVLTTTEGLQLLVIGNLAGFIFAVFVLAISVISFPMLIDRPVSAGLAIKTSFRAVMANPVTMALWGLMIAAALFVGSLPLFLGLAIILPVLGHATWHLYRAVVEV